MVNKSFGNDSNDLYLWLKNHNVVYDVLAWLGKSRQLITLVRRPLVTHGGRRRSSFIAKLFEVTLYLCKSSEGSEKCRRLDDVTLTESSTSHNVSLSLSLSLSLALSFRHRQLARNFCDQIYRVNVDRCTGKNFAEISQFSR